MWSFVTPQDHKTYPISENGGYKAIEPLFDQSAMAPSLLIQLMVR